MPDNSPASSGLSWLKSLQLSRVLLWRELRAGQLNIIVIALTLAVTAATVISVFSHRLDAGMLNKSTELLGADLRVLSSQKIEDTFYQQAQAMGLSTTTTLEFPSMVVAGNEMTLAAIKAVDQGYPLKGTVATSQDAFLSSTVNDTVMAAGPKPSEVWLESRLFALLKVNIGDRIEVGRKTFTVAAIITQESDRGGNFYSLSPRLMMNLSDIEGAGLIQAGSRVSWRLLAAKAPPTKAIQNGNDQAGAAQKQTNNSVESFQTWLTPRLSASQSIESLSDNNLALAASLDKARSFLSLAAVLSVLLSGIAIAMAAKDYAQHHFDTSAMLRTLGASRRQVLRLFILQLAYLAILTSIIGLILGTIIQVFLVDLLAGFFANTLPEAKWYVWAIASATAPITLVGFALPHLLQIGSVSPLRVLRRELEPMGWGAWSIYSLAMLSVFFLSLWFTRNILMSSIIVIGGFITLSLLMLLLQVLLKVAAKVIPVKRFSLYIRFAWQRIFKDTRSTSTQILAFSMILMVMIIISIVRHDLLADWQSSLPDDSPNFFAMNIQSYEVEQYQQALDKSGFDRNPLFPMVPGRLVEINKQAVHLDETLAKDPALQRDLALTWSDQLPESNEILQGTWLSDRPNTLATAEVSIESRLAGRLDVKLNDLLTFDVAGERFTVTVSSIRSVDWGTLRPNFYMIMSEDVLNSLPVSYLTSFHVSEGKQTQLTELIRSFPTVTLLDMTMVFVQIQALLEQVSLAVEYLLLLVLIAGILVLMAALHASLDERIQQGAILRTLGASSRQLRLNQWSEFALLGFISGFIALSGTEAICFILYNHLFDLPYQAQWTLWLWLPWFSALLIMILGALATKKTLNQPPIVVINQLF
jgi:putative ABC transport system permease protein